MTSLNTPNTVLRFPSGLYGVTPEWNDANVLEQAVRAATRGGMRALQFRHKSPDHGLRKELAQGLVTLCRELGVAFFINDDWRLALELKADGIHLGQHDDPVAMVRGEIGPNMLLGVSCYAKPQLARELLQYDVAYIAFGAMYASQTKPLAPPAPLSVLGEGRNLCAKYVSPRPAVVAIGGIGPQHAHDLATAGADSIAVIGSLFMAPDIEAAARGLSQPFSSST
jgi:thiamine-phosphate pyrophosphorylase